METQKGVIPNINLTHPLLLILSVFNMLQHNFNQNSTLMCWFSVIRV